MRFPKSIFTWDFVNLFEHVSVPVLWKLCVLENKIVQIMFYLYKILNRVM